MHVSGSEENFKQFTALKYRQSVRSAVCCFAVNIPLFFYNCIHFRSRSRPVFYGSGSGSGSEQTVSAAPAPAPAPSKPFRRLRLRLRLRPKCVGSGGSGSGSGSGSASLVPCIILLRLDLYKWTKLVKIYPKSLCTCSLDGFDRFGPLKYIRPIAVKCKTAPFQTTLRRMVYHSSKLVQQFWNMTDRP